MFHFKSPKTSLFRKITLWGAITTFTFSSIMAGVIFVMVFQEARENQDDTLEQVASVLARAEVSGKNPNAIWLDDDTFENWFLVQDEYQEAITYAGETIWIRTLHDNGQTIKVKLDRDYKDGAHTLKIDGESYRCYIQTLKSGQHIAVAQSTDEIQEAAFFVAFSTALPVLGLGLILFLVLTVLLYQATRPLNQLIQNINTRQANNLLPIDSSGVPQELLSLISSFNAMLERIKNLRQKEALFVADAAHELRTPLTALSLQVEQMEHEELPQRAKEKLQQLKLSVDRSTRLVNQLLLLKRAQIKKDSSYKPSSCSAQSVLSAVIETVWKSIEDKNIQFEANGFEQPDQSVPMHEDDFFAILRNLLENAIRYTPSNGTILVSLESEAPFYLTISDSGPGIEPKDRDRIFDPFYRVLGTGIQGTGLGLSIVKTLCENNHIQLTLQDTFPENPLGNKGLKVILCQK